MLCISKLIIMNTNDISKYYQFLKREEKDTSRSASPHILAIAKMLSFPLRTIVAAEHPELVLWGLPINA